MKLKKDNADKNTTVKRVKSTNNKSWEKTDTQRVCVCVFEQNQQLLCLLLRCIQYLSCSHFSGNDHMRCIHQLQQYHQTPLQTTWVEEFGRNWTNTRKSSTEWTTLRLSFLIRSDSLLQHLCKSALVFIFKVHPVCFGVWGASRFPSANWLRYWLKLFKLSKV